MLRSNTAFVTVALLAGCIWVGSLVCLAVVANAARRVLEPGAQVVFFRTVGRRYGVLGTGALLVAIGCGLVLGWPPSTWSPATAAAIGVSGALLAVSIGAMAQARVMTTLRGRLARAPDSGTLTESVRRGRALAGTLRGLMALLTLAIVVLVAQAVTH